MGVLDVNRFRPVMCWRRFCGFNTGAQWHMLPQSYPNYKTVHRRFQTWCCNEILRRVLTERNQLRDKGALDEEECFIDATFVMAKGGGSEIGPTKRGKGMKIMAIVDRHGLPLSVSTHAANHHEVRLVQLCFDFYMIEAKPENLIGDRAYDSDPLDEELRNDGIQTIAPHRSNRSKPPTQDRRRLSRYTRRWLVERFFAWIQWQRRILVRWSTTLRTSWALSSSPALLSSSGDFEIGSSLVARQREVKSAPLPQLYYHAHSLKWFESQKWPFRYKIDTFRVVDNEFMRRYIGDGWIGQLTLRLLYFLQSSFPTTCGKYGQYPAIVIYKE